MHQSVEQNTAELGEDGPAYSRPLRLFVEVAPEMLQETLNPPMRLPRRPGVLVRVGISGLAPAPMLARTHFKGGRVRALFAGLSAGSAVSLTSSLTSAYRLMLALSVYAYR